MIWGFRTILRHMKTWFNSKYFVPKFPNASCKQHLIWEYPKILAQENYARGFDIV